MDYTIDPVWARDEDHEACQQCRTKFSFLKRKHHCRRCGQLVCHFCSRSKAPVRELRGKPLVLEIEEMGGVHRCCDVCVKEMAPLEEEKLDGSKWESKWSVATNPESDSDGGSRPSINGLDDLMARGYCE
mmetsp:Transcript_22014/g.24460  ORF Transcript_22014/g.24460 Transcript_22014/m.24460 type:complete len:130 (-) Transcript_22014:98-487(-)